MANSPGNSIHWFRKCLRLHDNPAIVDAALNGEKLWPVFVLDPWIAKNMRIGPNRWRFLVQSLSDLDESLKKINSRLFILRGNPKEELPKAVKKWNITCITYESDTEPYSKQRDAEIDEIMDKLGVKVIKHSTNLIYNPEQVIDVCGKVPLAYQSFVNTAEKIGLPVKPFPSTQRLKEIFDEKKCSSTVEKSHDVHYSVPTLQELHVDETALFPCKYPGGETEALERLDRSLQDENYVCKFAKPDTSPNAIDPSTTVLSPYVKFGCLSARTFYYRIRDVYMRSKKGYTKPPVSLHGQLFWREFFYTVGSATPNFDKMVDNPVCTQIPWENKKEHLEAWENARTGYPFIDAIMTQLRNEGWIHHLARHSVACFLTRGDLWVSWEHGMKVFEELLLDADWSLNAGNWMWLSASAFFHQYYRVYSPIAFGKKTDPKGEYIRKYVPILNKFPPEYIYEPWKAPKKLQEQLGCVIGRDYPSRIVDHDKVRAENLKKMDAAYKARKAASGSPKKSPSPKKTPKTNRKATAKDKDGNITKFFKKK